MTPIFRMIPTFRIENDNVVNVILYESGMKIDVKDMVHLVFDADTAEYVYDKITRLKQANSRRANNNASSGRKGVHISEEMVVKIKRLADAGFCVDLIAKKVDLQKERVARLLWNRGYRRSRWTKPE